MHRPLTSVTAAVFCGTKRAKTSECGYTAWTCARSVDIPAGQIAHHPTTCPIITSLASQPEVEDAVAHQRDVQRQLESVAKRMQVLAVVGCSLISFPLPRHPPNRTRRTQVDLRAKRTGSLSGSFSSLVRTDTSVSIIPIAHHCSQSQVQMLSSPLKQRGESLRGPSIQSPGGSKPEVSSPSTSERVVRHALVITGAALHHLSDAQKQQVGTYHEATGHLCSRVDRPR